MHTGQLSSGSLKAPVPLCLRSNFPARCLGSLSNNADVQRLKASRRSPNPLNRGCRCQVHTVQSERRAATVASPSSYKVPTYVRATGRIVAIGDIHGDLRKAISSLEAARVLQEVGGQVRWAGGDTVVVQLGDVLDRGDSEIGVVMLLRELHKQAQLEGGAVYMLNGNHESLNVSGNFRYATPGGFRESALAAGLRGEDLQNIEKQKQARQRMYTPGGPMARELAKNPTVLIVNDTLFAHGGVLKRHGKDASSVMWNRMYSKEAFTPYDRFCVCRQLKATLEATGARHMIIGHTPQTTGANCECNGHVWRMDVGMSGGVLNALPQVLEIYELHGETTVRVVTAAIPCVPQRRQGARNVF
ncbi:MAG: hypothetical protein FRX49_03272 [Trebouxia sp. A1-2]|nr:MAG: hypothetical protein FRX49_03272 [Trebouxia sp. A1-2]